MEKWGDGLIIADSVEAQERAALCCGSRAALGRGGLQSPSAAGCKVGPERGGGGGSLSVMLLTYRLAWNGQTGSTVQMDKQGNCMEWKTLS